MIVPSNRRQSTQRRDVVQVRNPKTDRYIKVDRSQGRIVASKKSPGPYRDNTPIHRRTNR